jgi:hypothetical protein
MSNPVRNGIRHRENPEKIGGGYPGEWRPVAAILIVLLERKFRP